MASTDLTEFLSTVKSKNLAKATHFRLDLDIPHGLFKDAPRGIDLLETTRTISLFCYFAQFPPSNIQVSEIQTYGTPFWQPSVKLVDRMYIGMYLDQDFEIKKFFDAWIDAIFDKNTAHLRFRDDYSTTLTLHQLDAQFEPVYSVKLNDVFPTYIEPVSVHYSDKNKISTLTAQLCYRTWEHIPTELHREPPTDLGIFGQIPGALSTIYDAYSLYNQFKKKF